MNVYLTLLDDNGMPTGEPINISETTITFDDFEPEDDTLSPAPFEPFTNYTFSTEVTWKPNTMSPGLYKLLYDVRMPFKQRVSYHWHRLMRRPR